MTCSQHKTYRGVHSPRVNCKECRMVFTENQWGRITQGMIAQKLGVTVTTVKKYVQELDLQLDIPPVLELHQEAMEREHREEKRSKDKKIHAYESLVSELRQHIEAILDMKSTAQHYTIPKGKSSKTTATAFAIASDWHIEEVVKSSHVSGMNKFDEKVCQERVERFFRHTVKLIHKEQKAVKLDRLVLALLGDFISGTIHEDLAETNRLLPSDAIAEAHTHLSSGIRHLLKNTDLDILIVCHTGNHGRMTKQQRISAEQGNSLERYMYFSLAREFQAEKRVEFIIADGYHSYLDCYGYVVRFHHGHAVRYSGGVGGITIPVNKAIANWDKSRTADLDVFGHYHQFFDGGQFICNGSLIGYNAYALSIKASYEPPRQAFFLVDSEDGKTVVAPIILEHEK